MPEPEPATLEKTLLGDIFLQLTDELRTPERRRSTIRAIFAAVEGMLWVIKENIADTAAWALTAAEIALLREERYAVGSDGGAETEQLNLGFKQNVRFTVAMLRRLNAESSIKFDDKGWQSLISSLKVRDRLMHPKSISDLEVSEDDVTCALDGLLWFMGLSKEGDEAIRKFSETPEAKQRLMAKALRDYKLKPQQPSH